MSGAFADSSGNSQTSNAPVGSLTYGQASPITTDPTAASILFHSATTDHAVVPYNSLFDIGDVGTVECWVKRADSSTAEMEIVNRDQGLYLGLINNRLFITKTNVAGIAQSTITITDTTTWHHLVNTKNGSTVHQYIDAVDVTGTVTDATWQNGPTPGVAIGGNGSLDPYNGNLAEVAIYPTALSQARVQAHYNAAFTTATTNTIFRVGRGSAW